jgi:hypothetical protein
MAFFDRVSEGQLNERLMNAAGSDEPIIRRPSVSFLSKNHSPYLHHDTDSKFLWQSTRSFLQYDDGNGNQKHDRDPRGLRSRLIYQKEGSKHETFW